MTDSAEEFLHDLSRLRCPNSAASYVARECLKNRYLLPKNEVRTQRFSPQIATAGSTLVAERHVRRTRHGGVNVSYSRYAEVANVSLEYFIVCKDVSHSDADTNKIALFRVAEDVFPPSFPYQLPKVIAVSSWNIKHDEINLDFQVILRVTLPGQSAPLDFPMNLSKGRLRYRSIQGLLEIPIAEAGDLRFEVLLNRAHAPAHMVKFIRKVPLTPKAKLLVTSSPNRAPLHVP